MKDDREIKRIIEDGIDRYFYTLRLQYKDDFVSVENIGVRSMLRGKPGISRICLCYFCYFDPRTIKQFTEFEINYIIDSLSLGELFTKIEKEFINNGYTCNGESIIKELPWFAKSDYSIKKAAVYDWLLDKEELINMVASHFAAHVKKTKETNTDLRDNIFVKIYKFLKK